MLYHAVEFKGETKEVNIKIVEKNPYMIAHNGSVSVFDSYIVMKILPQWRVVVILIKNGAGVVSLKMFNGFVDKNKNVLNMFFLDVENYI